MKTKTDYIASYFCPRNGASYGKHYRVDGTRRETIVNKAPNPMSGYYLEHIKLLSGAVIYLVADRKAAPAAATPDEGTE